ncbi:MAG: pro-sigmaK processing inhibitor BofA family protein [Bacilli bacterium]|nr:pro-sigmaK processing inhibitor BofA family protein [Mycoplasmatota bacterium]MDD6264456.1 pro-sigmaK processing inhibitor BofA family protein [bacterium]MDY2697214.1 pro-sigmaK processing inhibitor BofA family protein [Bacilli bacterium]MDD6941193.1 pro-sigmaK processing inhibitor BofA family protein [bacterium]MDY5992908.1 pro-sigmaK processing inhibitor BofA family protein [Bacilli bacterium]
MKFILFVVKKIILSAFILYGYNLIAVNFNMIIPINVYTLGFITFLGSPALIALVLFKILAL